MAELNRDEIILRIVNRFLQWRLPENFQPDAGISFTPDFNVNTPWPRKHKPTGTNLFDATQAAAMVEAIAGEELDSLRVQLAEREGIARELAEMLRYAVTIIGHPDDAGMRPIQDALARFHAAEGE